MAGMKGRSVIVRRAGVIVAGCRTKSISVNGAPMDATNDDDAGWRTLLEEPGQLEVSISVAGICLSEQFRSEALSTTARVLAMTFQYGGFFGSPANTHGFSGSFYLSTWNEGAPYNEAVTFEAEFLSTGPVTYQAE